MSLSQNVVMDMHRQPSGSNVDHHGTTYQEPAPATQGNTGNEVVNLRLALSGSADTGYSTSFPNNFYPNYNLLSRTYGMDGTSYYNVYSGFFDTGRFKISTDNHTVPIHISGSTYLTGSLTLGKGDTGTGTNFTQLGNATASLQNVVVDGDLTLGLGSNSYPTLRFITEQHTTSPSTTIMGNTLDGDMDSQYMKFYQVAASQKWIYIGDNTAGGPSYFNFLYGDTYMKNDSGGEGHNSFTCQVTASMGPTNPRASDTYDLGTTSLRWRNLYTTDLQLSNLGREEGNVVDGTKGDWTLQEGEEDLFVINNISGKKYKIALIPTEEP